MSNQSQSMAVQLAEVAPLVPKTAEVAEVQTTVPESKSDAKPDDKTKTQRPNGANHRRGNPAETAEGKRAKSAPVQFTGALRHVESAGVVKVKVRPAIKAYTLDGAVWENENDEIILVINKTPFGRLCVKLEKARKWKGAHSMVLRRVPDSIDLTYWEIPSIEAWESADKPQYLAVEQSPWGKLVLCIERGQDEGGVYTHFI